MRKKYEQDYLKRGIRRILAMGFSLLFITTAAQSASVCDLGLRPNVALAATEQKSKDESNLSKLILEKNPAYSNYHMETISADYEGKGIKSYVFLFASPDSSKEDEMNYSVDLWYGNENGVGKIAVNQYILPDTYQSITLAGKTYFRYDLSYATGSQTILLAVQNGRFQTVLKAPGSCNFQKNNNHFTVLSDAYDMNYSKTDKLTYGHTWKNYYFYADKDGIHEYGATKITKTQFLKYKNAKQILSEINSKYKSKSTKVTTAFLHRSNDLIHINITSEQGDFNYYYYETYYIDSKKGLVIETSDVGKYKKASMPKIAVY